MEIQTTIEKKLRALTPEVLRVENESGKHNVPAGSESHFKVTLVSAKFDGAPPVARHRMVNEILSAELAAGVHALALHLKTPAEWARDDSVAPSPPCLGGSASRA